MTEDKDAAELHDPSSPATDAAAETPGALLQRAREEAGLSRRHVADRLNLLNNQVVSIEQDCYDRLPGDTFTVGYLRNYARVVGLDADRVLQAFFTLRPQCRPVRVRVDGVVNDKRPTRPIALTDAHPRRHYWGLVAAGLLLAVLWGWQQVRAPIEVLPLSADFNGVDIDLPGGLGVIVADQDNAGLLDSVQLQDMQPGYAQSQAQAMRAVATLPDTVRVAEPGTDDASATPAGSDRAPLADSADDRLNLRFTADCWVEVKDRDNRVLVAALKRADEQLLIEGQGPFKVVLGFAPGVEMAFNGEPVDIETSSGAYAARLIVGNS